MNQPGKGATRSATPDFSGQGGLELGELPAKRHRAAAQALASCGTRLSTSPEVARPLGAYADLDELQELVDEARRYLGDW